MRSTADEVCAAMPPMNELFNVFALLIGAYAMGCTGTVSLTCETNVGKAGHTCFSGTASGGTVESDTCPPGYAPVDNCPTANELGGCAVKVTGSGATVTTTIYYYSDDGFTAAQAEAECKAQPVTTTATTTTTITWTAR
jgi:hypothetical protein